MKTGLSERTVRTCFVALEKMGMIVRQTTKRFSIVTILNWSNYQGLDEEFCPSERPAERPTSDQQATTNKNDKELKEEIYIPAPETTELDELATRVYGATPASNLSEALKTHTVAEIRQAMLKTEAAGVKHWNYTKAILEGTANPKKGKNGKSIKPNEQNHGSSQGPSKFDGHPAA
jgi:hypothetical protein